MAPAEVVQPQPETAAETAAPAPAEEVPSQPPPPEDIEYDDIFVGTSIAGSLLAGALAQSGKKVLCLEPSGWYGQLDATVDFQQLRKVSGLGAVAASDSGSEEEADQNNASSAPQQQLQPAVELVPVSDVLSTSHIVLRHASQTDIPAELDSRAFSIDLMPRLIFASGSIVEALIRSNVSSYVDFRAVQATFIYAKGEFHQIPSSKGEIFQSKLLSLVEKRSLMKFMTTCTELFSSASTASSSNGAQTEPSPGTDGITFKQYLSSQGLSEMIQNIILYAIALCQSDGTDVSSTKGMAMVKKHILSVGRYGPQPLLLPNFGLGELAQGFSRYCAVFGGIHVLRRAIASICKDTASGAVAGVVDSTGQQWKGKRVHLCTGATRSCGRSVHILGQSIIPESSTSSEALKTQCAFLVIPPGSLGNKNVVHMIQYDYSISCAPAEKYVMHIFAYGEAWREDLNASAKSLSSQPLWTCRWELPGATQTPSIGGLQTVPYSVSLDADELSDWAEEMFHTLCGPDADFIAERTPADEDFQA